MTTYSAVYTKQLSANVDPVYQPEQIRVSVEVLSVQGFSDLGLFVYRKDPITLALDYSHVASPYDISEYNYQNIGTKDYVRLATISIVLGNADVANEALSGIETQIQALCIDMKTLSDLLPVTTVTATSG